MGKNALGQGHDEDNRPLQALGFMHSEQANTILLVLATVLGLLFELRHAVEKLADRMIAAPDLLQFLQLVEAALQFALVPMFGSLGVFIVVVMMLAINVAQVLVISQRAQQLDSSGGMVMAAFLHAFNHLHKIIETRLIFIGQNKGLLHAELEERTPAGV